MSNKPLVFNYGHYENLRDQANDMALEIEELRAKVEKQMWEVMAVKGENTTLKCELESVQSKYDVAKSIIEIQQDIISKYGNVFKLQEAELIKLRNEVCDNARNTNDSKETM